ncbi:MAG: ParB/RepB/Spo0J family partition protein [Synergistetes bacterium]|nr:ParB/RepB/Spo0J family partition protein [Synergistota bacterium]
MGAKVKGGLGKGLGALIPSASEGEKLKEISIDSISPNPFQPRQTWDDGALEELVASIRRYGVLQPIIVRKTDRGYEVVAGERRLRAAKKAGFTKIPAIVRELSDRDLMEYALVENLQREDLNPIEAARAIKNLIDRFGLTQEEVADRIGKKRSTVANILRLLKLPLEIQNMLAEGRITMGHARAILSLSNPDDQIKLAQKIVNNSLSVRDVEKEVSRKVRLVERDRKIEEKFLRLYRRRVRVKRSPQRSVEIFFNSDAEMEKFLAFLEDQVSALF